MPDKISHMGLHTQRLHPEAGNPVEVIFARRWEEENRVRTGCPTPLLAHLIGQFSQRDAEVAATIVQWLGSHVGQSFVGEAMKESGMPDKRDPRVNVGAMKTERAAITAAIAAERNACAMVAEDERVSGETGTEEDAAYNCACCDIARAIRARR